MNVGVDGLRLIVGVGASAGGLEAFKEFLSSIPEESGMAFLLVQHLAPEHRNLLVELLGPVSRVAVVEAAHSSPLRPNTAYVILPGTTLAVAQGCIELSEPPANRRSYLPVDHLFRSLAREYGARAAGIVLSGAGSDGSDGSRALKASGGLTIAQEPGTCGQPGMPASAIRAGVTDLTLEIREMYRALDRFARLAPAVAEPTPDAPVADLAKVPDANTQTIGEAEISQIAAIVKPHLDFDFSVYKAGTVGRRVRRRMAVSDVGTFEKYLEVLRDVPQEQEFLVRDLLIGVTEFFRDPQSFEALREKVIEPLVAEVTTGTTLRVWVPGCSTGEEAYSLGMEFLEAMESRGDRLSLQIFATDIDQTALSVARAGIYSQSAVEAIAPGRLERFFASDDHRFRVRPRLRDTISFAPHDLTKDPPFSGLHLVSCRNVLIYLRPEAQRRVLKLLHFSLLPHQSLFLSSSESVGAQRDLFATLSKPWRIYRKVGTSRPVLVQRSRRSAEDPSSDPTDLVEASPDRAQIHDLGRRAVLQVRVAPTVIVAVDGRILFSHGELSPFLRFPQGESPRLELSELLRPELANRVRAALYRCRNTGARVEVDSSPDIPNGPVRILADPATGLGEGSVILTFEELPKTANVEPGAVEDDSAAQRIIDQLESELEATREDLRTTVQELETSNVDLRFSNEESMSMNEELQAANEELEATTEELRSLNEELTTVNSQLCEKVQQLEEAHDALNNFFASTKVATLFLDEHLNIRRFTPAAADLLRLDEKDLGRPMDDLGRDLLEEDLEKTALDVLENLASRTMEVSHDGRWYERTVLPYRTESRHIEGVVVTFRDITELRSANLELLARAERLELAWETLRGGVYEHQIPLDKTTFHSKHWAAILGFEQDELPTYDRFQRWLNDRVHPDDIQNLNRANDAFISGETERFDVEIRLLHAHGHWVWVRAVSRALERDESGHVKRLVGLMVDITESKRLAEERLERDILRDIADGLPAMIWIVDSQGNPSLVNDTARRFFGFEPEEQETFQWAGTLHPADRKLFFEELGLRLLDHHPFAIEARSRQAGGGWRWLRSEGRPRFSSDGTFRGFVGISVDITERRQAEEGLKDADRRKDDFLAMLGHELRNPIAAIQGATEILRDLGDDPERRIQAVSVLDRQIDHVTQLLDPMLEVSRVSRGKIRLRKSRVSLTRILGQVVADREREADKAGLSIETDLTEDLLEIEGDPLRLSQIFSNLLGNSIKFTEPGGSIRVHGVREQDWAVVRIFDDGAGIDPALQGKLFEAFQQGPQDLARESGGLGLGLSLSLALVKLHRGQIDVHSDGKGHGTEVVVRLPLALPGGSEDPEVQVPAKGASLRILLIEDAPDVGEMMRELLLFLGHQVDWEMDGPRGIAAFEKNRPDVVICDLGLPGGITGYDVARRLHRDFSPPLPFLIALTGYGRKEDRERSAAAGFDVHVTKPVRRSTLEELLAGIDPGLPGR